MPLTIHDTAARDKRLFEPRDPERVTLYVCGITAYNYAHIGNARPAVVFDVLYRLLRRLYGAEQVVYARNITDVDDKIYAAAQAQGEPISAITDRFTAIYEADMAALGVLTPDLEPRATDHIAEMLAMIGRLVDGGFAYAAEGHVLFDTQAFPDYGRLSGRSLDDLIAGARVEVAPYKRHPADFVLWKPCKPGEPPWDSPFGPGRPGWHIECSAMIETNLGLPVDIHGGGHDLIFPHHENELAQGVCAQHGHGEYARYWMHNGFLTLDAEKMSKSLGNVLLVHDLLEKVPGEVIRWALLSAHYRAPLDWTGALLEQSRNSLDRLYQVLRDAKARLQGFDTKLDVWQKPQIDPKVDRVRAVLEDDLNTPGAIRELFWLGDFLRSTLDRDDDIDGRDAIAIDRELLVQSGALLGVLQADPDAWFEGGADEAFRARVDELIARRSAARRAKDWALADRLRAEITELGVEVQDEPGGTATWRLKEG